MRVTNTGQRLIPAGWGRCRVARLLHFAAAPSDSGSTEAGSPSSPRKKEGPGRFSLPGPHGWRYSFGRNASSQRHAGATEFLLITQVWARAGSSRHSPILRSSSLVLKRQSNVTIACLHELTNSNWRAPFRVRNRPVGQQQLRRALIFAAAE